MGISRDTFICAHDGIGVMALKIPIGRAHYFYAYGIDASSGKGHVLGGYTSEDAARDMASDFDSVRIFRLPTRDMNRATGMIKAKMIGKAPLRQVLSRVRRSKNNVQEPQSEQREQPDEDRELFSEGEEK